MGFIDAFLLVPRMGEVRGGTSVAWAVGKLDGEEVRRMIPLGPPVVPFYPL